MRAQLSPARPDAGITLVEVMVAVLVLSIGTVAAFQSLDAARRQIGQAPERFFADQVALNRIAAWQALPRATARALPEEIRYANRDWQIEQTTTTTRAGFEELTVRVRQAEGPGALLVAYLPAETDARP